MPDKVTVVRRDGTLLDATPEQAERLKLLGYREQTPQENEDVLRAESRADYYSSPGEQATAGAEGFNSGLTFGLSDYTQGLLWGDEVQERARYNPGTRLATETLGALAPLLLSGGESASVTAAQLAEESGALRGIRAVASTAPTSLLAEGAGRLAGLGAAEGSLAKTVLQGTIEGGVYGGAGAADHAWLDGDPLTAETILHGVGWGSVLGGGLSALGHGLGKLGEAAGGLHETPTPTAKDVSEVGGKSYEALRGEVENLREELNQAAKSADSVVSGASEIAKTAESKALVHEITDSQIISEQAAGTLHPAEDVTASQILDVQPDRNPLPKPISDSQIVSVAPDLAKFPKEVAQAEKLYGRAMSAADRGDYTGAMEAAGKYSDHMKQLSDRLGLKGVGTSEAGMKSLIEIRALRAELGQLPKSITEFAAMTPKKAERVFAALEQAGKMPGVKAGAVKDAVTELVTDLGLAPEKGLRQAWQASKEMARAASPAAQARAAKAAEEDASKPSFLRKMAGYALGGKAYGAIRVAGGGHAAAYAGYRAVSHAITHSGADLAGLRGAVLGRIKSAAETFAPAAGAITKLAAPRIEPLAASLVTGRLDSDTKDVRELAQRRAREIGDLGPVIRDYMFKQLETLSAVQPKLAPAVHQAALLSFGALQGMIPKDPGVISKLQPIWKPSDVQAVVMAKQLEVFHDPVAAATNMLASGQFDPIKISAMKEMAPQIWQNLRVELLKRVSDPAVAEKMSYQDQIGLSALLDIPIHTSMQPQYIAASQAVFAQRSAPLKANPRMGQGGAGTLPNPQDNVNATQSQKSTAR